MIRKRRYRTSNYWWISISNVYAIYVFLQTRWSVKTSIFPCHEIKRWYSQERSIMDTSLNTWYLISLGSNRFRFLVESGRSARDARKQEQKSSCFLCAWCLGRCGAYLAAPKDCFLWNICPEKQNFSRIFYSLRKAKNRSTHVQFSKII